MIGKHDPCCENWSEPCLKDQINPHIGSRNMDVAWAEIDQWERVKITNYSQWKAHGTRDYWTKSPHKGNNNKNQRQSSEDCYRKNYERPSYKPNSNNNGGDKNNRGNNYNGGNQTKANYDNKKGEQKLSLKYDNRKPKPKYSETFEKGMNFVTLTFYKCNMCTSLHLEGEGCNVEGDEKQSHKLNM